MSLPKWLADPGGNPSAPASHPVRGNAATVARKGLSEIAKALSDSKGRGRVTSDDGFYQRVDPRTKVVLTTLFVVASTIVHSWLALALCYALAVFICLVSNLSGERLWRVWLTVPLFTLVLMLPATLNLFNPGAVLIRLSGPVSVGAWTIPNGLSVTLPGALAAARMCLRTACCVTFVLALAFSTPNTRLFKGLRSLGVPGLFVTVLDIMNRYLQAVSQTAQEIHLAKISRTLERSGLRTEHEWVAAGVGSLYRRTLALSQNVQWAMVSRGYTGEVRTHSPMRMDTTDWLLLIVSLLVFGLVVGLG